jgi:thiol-disulfide isomerase/thioredoxin
MRSYCFVLSAVILTGLTLLGAGSAAFPGEKDSQNTVKLEKLTWAQFQKRLVNQQVKYTIVDAWSTTCAPCKENFPHVVEMHRKYGPKGLAVISLSLDDPSNEAAVAAAAKFLKAKNAVFTNVLLNEPSGDGDGFDKLNINAIPAVFLYGPDGKEVKRFTMDDPDNQFTYDEVEKTVAALLGPNS